MAEYSGPWDGQTDFNLTRWRELNGVLPDGVMPGTPSDMATCTGSDLVVSVLPFKARVQGSLYNGTADASGFVKQFTLPTLTSGQTAIHYIVLRYTPVVGDLGSISLALVSGTPTTGTATPPPLTMSKTGVWEYPVVQVNQASGAIKQAWIINIAQQLATTPLLYSWADSYASGYGNTNKDTGAEEPKSRKTVVLDRDRNVLVTQGLRAYSSSSNLLQHVLRIESITSPGNKWAALLDIPVLGTSPGTYDIVTSFVLPAGQYSFYMVSRWAGSGNVTLAVGIRDVKSVSQSRYCEVHILS